VPGIDIDDPTAVLAGQLGVELGLDAGQPVAVVVRAADQRRGRRAVRVLAQVLPFGDNRVAMVGVEQWGDLLHDRVRLRGHQVADQIDVGLS